MNTADVARAHDLQPMGVTPGLREYVRDVWRYRDFVWQLSLADVRSRALDTVLGELWHVVTPIIMALTYFVIFGVVLGGRDGIDNYVAYLVIGVFVFTLTRKSLVSGAKVVVARRRLVESLAFPRAVLPLSAVTAEVVAFLPSLAIVAAVLLLSGEAPTWSWLVVPAVVALHAAFILGLALATSRLTTQFRDMEHILPNVARIWFYVSAVLYSLDRLERALGTTARAVAEVNPAYVYIQLVRGLTMDGIDAEPRLWAYGVVWAVVSVALGLGFFRARETRYAG